MKHLLGASVVWMLEEFLNDGRLLGVLDPIEVLFTGFYNEVN